MINGLVKGNSDIIGFVIASLFRGAINNDELIKWAENIVKENEVVDIPDYIFDLVSFDGERSNLFQIIGFSCSWKCTKSQSKALYGIAVKRGNELGEECTPKAALKALEKHPEVEQRFRETFPFIDF